MAVHIFEKFSLKNKELEFLEIGSFEGRTSYFFLVTLKKYILHVSILLNHFMNCKIIMMQNLTMCLKTSKKILLNFPERLTIEERKILSFF